MFLVGSYVYVYDRQQSTMATTNANLLSPVLHPKETTDCFSFYYYIHGEGNGEITLNIMTKDNSETIWTRKNSAGDKWHLNKINVGPKTTIYQVQSKLFVNTFAQTSIMILARIHPLNRFWSNWSWIFSSLSWILLR